VQITVGRQKVGLEGKVALVTGSGRGIGRAIAVRLAQDGADIVVNYFRNRPTAEETAALVQATGRKALVVKAHVGDVEQLQHLFETIRQEFGYLDIFVANAASGIPKNIIDVDVKGWEWTMNINARSLLLGAREAVKLMNGRPNGRIIAITSLGSTRVLPNYGVIGVSKAAIDALVRYLGVDLIARGITVNAIAPGVVATHALTFFPQHDRIIEEAIKRTPAGRLCTPEEVAAVASFLCSESAAMIVGQVITIDGGASLPFGMG
jgi:enoyl-[acyl-carrier protein] reductase III